MAALIVLMIFVLAAVLAYVGLVVLVDFRDRRALADLPLDVPGAD